MSASFGFAPHPICRCKIKTNHLIGLAVLAIAGLQPQARAQAVITLGSASSYGVLANSTIANAGSTTVHGDLGLSPGTSITGPAISVTGTAHVTDTAAGQARTDALAAYNVLTGAGETAGGFTSLSGDLGGRTLSPGVYSFGTGAATLTGTLILDAASNPNARFDFLIGAAFTAVGASSIILNNLAQAANVFWQVGTSATLGAGTTFSGNILAAQSITLITGATVNGRLLALGAAMTLDGNTITVPTAIPEPATNALIGGLAVLGLAFWRRRRVTS